MSVSSSCHCHWWPSTVPTVPPTGSEATSTSQTPPAAADQLSAAAAAAAAATTATAAAAPLPLPLQPRLPPLLLLRHVSVDVDERGEMWVLVARAAVCATSSRMQQRCSTTAWCSWHTWCVLDDRAPLHLDGQPRSSTVPTPPPAVVRSTRSSETPPAAADRLGDRSPADPRQRGGVSGPPQAAEGRAALCAAFDRWLLVPTLQALAGESFLPVESNSD